MKAELTNKIMLGTGITVAATALAAAAISVFNTPEAPDPNQLGARKKLVYMSSKNFTRLPEKEKEEYIKKLGRSSMKEYKNLSTKEQDAVRKNTRKPKMEMFKKRINKFFSMTKEEQDKHLDKQIEKWDKMRKKWKRRAAANKAKNKTKSTKTADNKNRTARINAAIQNFTEKMDSNTRAQMMEYFRRLQERRKKLN